MISSDYNIYKTNNQYDESEENKQKEVKWIFFCNKMAKFLPYGCLKKFCEQTTIHGFSHVVIPGRHPLERLLWGFVTLLAIAGAIQLCLDQWQRYVDSPTVVTLEKDFRTWNYSFPAITACVQETMAPDKVKAVIDRLWGLHPGDEKYDYYMKFVQIVRSAQLTNLKRFSEFADDPTLNVDMFQIAVEVTPQFLGKTTWFDRGLAPSWIRVMTEMGVCYTVNSIVTIDVQIGNISLSDGIPYTPVICQYAVHLCYVRIELYDSPVYYYPHSPYDVIDPTSPHDHLHLGKDRSTELRLTESRAAPDIRGLSLEQRRCLFHDEPTQSMRQTYSSNMCRRSCRNRLAIKLCGCKPFFNVHESGPACNASGLVCLSRYTKELLKIPKQLISCTCLPQCVDAVYQQLTFKENVWAGPFAARSAIRYAIMSPRSRYRREIVFYFEDLVVSFGGAAGLFLGCSFLSFVEILYFLCERIVLATCASSRRSRVGQHNNNETSDQVGAQESQTYRRGQELDKDYYNNLQDGTFIPYHSLAINNFIEHVAEYE